MALMPEEKRKKVRPYTFMSRKKGMEKTSMKKEAKIWEKIEDIPRCGCEESCLHRHFGDHLEHVRQHQNAAASRDYPLQRRSVLQYLSQNTDLITKKTSWTLLARSVCQFAWGAYHGIASSTLGRYRKEHRDGINPDSCVHGNQEKAWRSSQR